MMIMIMIMTIKMMMMIMTIMMAVAIMTIMQMMMIMMIIMMVTTMVCVIRAAEKARGQIVPAPQDKARTRFMFVVESVTSEEPLFRKFALIKKSFALLNVTR